MVNETPDNGTSPGDGTGDIYMIVSDSGEPVAVIDMDKITGEGAKLAFAVAAHCGDPGAMDQIQAATLDRVGVEAFGYVAACALRTMAEHILSPSFDVAQAYGTDLRAGMRAIAESRDPS